MIDYIRSQIKKRRAEKGLTQSDVALDLGITAGAYNKIETGPTAITIQKLEEISTILEVDISYFFQKEKLSNKLEDHNRGYGFATKSDIEELINIIKKMQQDIDKLKASSPVSVSKKKKKGK